MSTQVEALHLSLHELEGLLKECAPLMGGFREKSMDREIKYGTDFAEVSCPISTLNE